MKCEKLLICKLKYSRFYVTFEKLTENEIPYEKFSAAHNFIFRGRPSAACVPELKAGWVLDLFNKQRALKNASPDFGRSYRWAL